MVDFDEYLCVMVTYCMYSKDEIMRFCFECFDVDQSGDLSRSAAHRAPSNENPYPLSVSFSLSALPIPKTYYMCL